MTQPRRSRLPETARARSPPTATGVGAARGDGTRLAARTPLRSGYRRCTCRRRCASPRAGRIALASIVVGAAGDGAVRHRRPAVLVPRSSEIFPAWEAGRLRLARRPQASSAHALGYGLSALILRHARPPTGSRSSATADAVDADDRRSCIVAAHVILLLGPPFQLTDMCNYLGYARLGGLHGLNPYTHVIGQEMHDPIYHFATWHNLHSPYGELFTALTYPLAFLPLPVAYWIVKVVTVAAQPRVHRARLEVRAPPGPRPALRRGARRAATRSTSSTRSGASTTTSSCSCRRRRDRAAAARAATGRPAPLLMVAVAVKFTAVLLLPFLLVGARPSAPAAAIIVGLYSRRSRCSR